MADTMSARVEDGGPAFPTHDQDEGTDPRSQILSGGMSLRDYFAAKAMTGVIMNPRDYENVTDQESMAAFCYRAADALLKAREPKS